MFSHIREQVDDDELEGKLKRIREIRLAGFEVAHVIHRHGLDESTAFEVEAALIDAYPGLTNLAGGAGSGDYGVMHAREVIRKYRAESAVFDDRALLINVNKTAAERSLYEAVRFAWRINREKASEAEVVLATTDGMIRGAFIAEEWLDATAENFPGREHVPGRVGFVGRAGTGAAVATLCREASARTIAEARRGESCALHLGVGLSRRFRFRDAGAGDFR